MRLHRRVAETLEEIYGDRPAPARRGEAEEALSFLDALLPWLERAPAWTPCFPLIACHAAEVLWVLERTDHLELIDRVLRERVVAPISGTP